ncbi:unnamed protein product [Periconia digitata]|uniref:Uncharacterized protein n=1 Tax=Periconia digitata TaxID=1303443 RepID=A0A9W4XYI6_9PLEO|nr:unnamed protein product [Periconia digitata]
MSSPAHAAAFSIGSIHVRYDDNTIPQIAAEVYDGTVHETTLRLFCSWLNENDKNFHLAAKYIRELKLPEDYSTLRIKNYHLRALLDARVFRPKYEMDDDPNNPYMTITDAFREESKTPKATRSLPRPIPHPFSTPSRSAHPAVAITPTSTMQPRSPFTTMSPAWRSLRARAVSKNKKLSIADIPKPLFPPDVPERPKPLVSPSTPFFTPGGDAVPAFPPARMKQTDDPFVEKRGAGARGEAEDTAAKNDKPSPAAATTTTSPAVERKEIEDEGIQEIHEAPANEGSTPPYRTPRRRLPLPDFTFPDTRPTSVDMEALEPFEASWRRTHRHLLISAYGRENAVLSDVEIQVIEDMALAERAASPQPPLPE